MLEPKINEKNESDLLMKTDSSNFLAPNQKYPKLISNGQTSTTAATICFSDKVKKPSKSHAPEINDKEDIDFSNLPVFMPAELQKAGGNQKGIKKS